MKYMIPRIALSAYLLVVAYQWHRNRKLIDQMLTERRDELWLETAHFLVSLAWPITLCLWVRQTVHRVWTLMRIFATLWLMYFQLKWRFGFRTKIKFAVIELNSKR